ncbi:MAG: DUF1304 domain-containing protein [Deltaproteobacteria bacterium]
MLYFAIAITVVVSLIHLYIFWMETFAWETARVRATFGTDAAFAKASKALAGNQGVYNLVLALGLLAGLALWNVELVMVFLAGVMVVGFYGAATVSERILFVQALPAGVGIMAWVLSLGLH